MQSSCSRKLTQLVPAALLVSTYLACGTADRSTQQALPEGLEAAKEWRVEIAHAPQSTDNGEIVKIGGCTVGDVLAEHDGHEIVAGAADGKVHVLRRHTDGTYTGEVAAEVPGEMIQVAVGDVLPAIPGDEIVAVGAAAGPEGEGVPGAAWLIWRESGEFKHRLLLRDDDLLHGVAMADMDPERPGDEVVVAGYTMNVYMLRPALDGTKDPGPLLLGMLAGPAKGMSRGVSFPDTDLNRESVAIVSADGSFSVAGPISNDEARFIDPEDESENGYRVRWIKQYADALARVGAEGSWVAYSGNGGTLRVLDLVELENTETVTRVEDRLRGAVFCEFDGTRGFELATAGYDGAVRVFNQVEDDTGGTVWAGEVVAREDARFHHLAGGKLPGVGSCLVACGYSGRVLVISQP